MEQNIEQKIENKVENKMENNLVRTEEQKFFSERPKYIMLEKTKALYTMMHSYLELFPKSEKFTLRSKIEDTLLELIRLLIMQNYQQTNEKVKKLINISGFKEYDWVVVKGYYAMYMASLACLAKLGLKSENHNATISALEFYFVEKGKLERNYLEILKNVSLEKGYVDSLKGAKDDRITAQYNVSEEFEKRKAEEMIENAKAFVDRMEKLFYEISREEEKRRKQEEERKLAEEERMKRVEEERRKRAEEEKRKRIEEERKRKEEKSSAKFGKMAEKK